MRLLGGGEGAADIVRRSYGLDYRSLALFRIVLGLVIVGDLADRAHDLHNHYTDDGTPRYTLFTLLTSTGVFPRRLAMMYGHGFWLNPYLMNGSYTFASILFCLHAVVGLLLCLGYRTRVMIVLAWIMHAGLQARNISVSHGGDIYFRCILFWSLFLPLARVWSIDRYLKDQEGPPRRPKSSFFFGTASVAYVLQPTFMYILAYYLKTHEWWTKDYIAAYYALRLEYFTDGMPLGQFLLRHPEILPLFTWASLVWEGFGPLLYFSPMFHGPLRFLAAFGMIALHLGFSMSLRLGTFFWITVTAQLALFPAWFWDFLLPRLRSLFPPLDNLLLAGNRNLQRVLPPTASALRAASLMLGVRRTSPTPKAPRVGIARWKRIARKVGASLLVAAMCTSALGWNVSTMYNTRDRDESLPPFVKWTDRAALLGERLGIDQNWGMFAPHPPEGDYWFVIECLDRSGTIFELFRNGGLFSWEGSPVSFDIPEPFIKAWYNHRWAKYWETYVDKFYSEVRGDLARWVCQEWNARHEPSEHIAEFDLWIVEHGHLLNGSTVDWGRTHLWHAECYPKETTEPTEGHDVGEEKVQNEGEQEAPQAGEGEGGGEQQQDETPAEEHNNAQAAADAGAAGNNEPAAEQ